MMAGSHHGICDIAEQNSCERMFLCQDPDWAPHCFHHSFLQAVLWLFHIHHSCISNSNLFFLFSCISSFLKRLTFLTIFTAVSCQFLFKLLLCIGVLIARDSESKTSIIIFNSLPRGCIRIRTLCLLSLGGLGSVRVSGSSTCDLPPAAGWEAGLQADQLLTSWDERIRFCGSAQRSNNLVLNIKSSVCLSYLCCCLDL